MTVLVVDYGLGNLGSVRRALEECGADVLVSDDPAELKLASRILLPGVGAFNDGMQLLRQGGWVDALRKAVLEDGIPLLGICLGMQLLMEQGSEGGDSPGLGLLAGRVRRMTPQASSERIPHIGWNDIRIIRQNPLLSGIADGTDFYFVHSYCIEPEAKDVVLAKSDYAGGFPAIVANGHVYGAQFHPEKSAHSGFQLLRNFMAVSQS